MLIIDYQPKWQEDFNTIKEVLTKALSSSTLTIEHIGSTAVKGLAAKPIIDIDIVYENPDDFYNIIMELSSIGYTHVGDQGIIGREVFKRDKATLTNEVLDAIPHHLYMCHSGSDEHKRHLAFRDHLRNNENARMNYAHLKLELAKQANQEKKKYALLKVEQAKDFIEATLAKVITN